VAANLRDFLPARHALCLPGSLTPGGDTDAIHASARAAYTA